VSVVVSLEYIFRTSITSQIVFLLTKIGALALRVVDAIAQVGRVVDEDVENGENLPVCATWSAWASL